MLTPRTVLLEEVGRRGTQSAVARWLGVSRAHVSDMLAGRRDPGPRLLKKLGLSKSVLRRVTYLRCPR